MCASYGLDPRVSIAGYEEAFDHAVLDALRSWASSNGGETLLPTGIRARNLNPIITAPDALTLAWWGYLIDGKSARFPSINTRSERLETGKGPLGTRAIVPASYWREFQKPSKALHHLSLPDHGLLAFAAIARPGFTADGEEYTCYSLVMQPAVPKLEHIHDRMPLLVPAGFVDEWLHSDAPAPELIAGARNAAQPVAERVTGTLQGAAEPGLF